MYAQKLWHIPTAVNCTLNMFKLVAEILAMNAERLIQQTENTQESHTSSLVFLMWRLQYNCIAEIQTEHTQESCTSSLVFLMWTLQLVKDGE